MDTNHDRPSLSTVQHLQKKIHKYTFLSTVYTSLKGVNLLKMANLNMEKFAIGRPSGRVPNRLESSGVV